MMLIQIKAQFLFFKEGNIFIEHSEIKIIHLDQLMLGILK